LKKKKVVSPVRAGKPTIKSRNPDSPDRRVALNKTFDEDNHNH
jgi:hypothetical protein